MKLPRIKRLRPTLGTYILVGLVLGILCGLTFGEYCASLQIVGNAFIRLLQMSILPYIVFSLLAGIGRLSFDQAKLLAVKGGTLLLVFWTVAFVVILLMPLAFPYWESASFFSTSVLEPERDVDFVAMYIPANPFQSLAESVIPAVVLFCIVLGVALIGTKEKQGLIQPLTIAAAALTKVAHFVVYLTPIGVFAIAASATGTMPLEDLGRLQVYVVTFIVAALLLSFWILPALTACLTPFSYREIVRFSRGALVTGFATGNLLIVLPILIDACKRLIQSHRGDDSESMSLVDVIVPVVFNFPSTGKLLALLFVLFASWFYAIPLSLGDYPNFIVLGLFSFFGSIDAALPFLLDTLQIPSDAFQLYLLTGIINGRFATLVAAMHLLTFTLITTCAISGMLSLNLRRLAIFGGITAAITLGAVVGTRVFLKLSVSDEYTKDRVIASMQLLENPVLAVVHKTVPPLRKTDNAESSSLARIRKRGVLRVGYHPGTLPFSYFNGKGELVGFNVDMAHRLARELKVRLEFIPTKRETLAQQLEDGQFDIAMVAAPVTPDFLQEVELTRSFLDVTAALVVPDHLDRNFDTFDEIRDMKNLRIGMTSLEDYFLRRLREDLPNAELVQLKSPKEYFERTDPTIDAWFTAAEVGSAWTLLYPKYRVVVPRPGTFRQPIAYPVSPGNREMVRFMNAWIELKEKDGTIGEIYKHWVLGRGAEEKEPRWSLIRDVLHWVD